jgi:hypothetical protein
VEFKKCTKCKRKFQLEKFAFRNRALNKRRSICKFCVKGMTDHHYKVKKESYRLSQIKRRNRNREFILNYLADKACIDCGYSDPRALDFDHVRGNKVKSISRMIIDRCPTELILLEIEKCDIRCANCHRIVTCKRGNFHRQGINRH